MRKGQAIDYLTRPPIRMPTNMENQEANLLPGGIVYGDDQGTITPLWQVGMDLQHLLADMQDVRKRIARAFYADLFLMVSQRDTQMTATEVQERHEEKMQMVDAAQKLGNTPVGQGSALDGVLENLSGYN